MKKFTKWLHLMALCMLAVMGLPAALSADAEIARKDSGLQSFPVAGSSTQIYKGALVCVNTSGYLVAGANTQGYRFAGIAYENVLNAGSDGDKACKVYTMGRFLLPATSITQAMVGRYVYLVDDATVDESIGNAICVGRLVEYVSTTSGWIDIAQRQDLLGQQDHLYLIVDKSDKNVRISPTYTVSASIIALQVKPAAGVTLTSGIVGVEVEPRVNDTFGGTSIHGIFSGPWKRGTGAAGDLSGDMLAFEGKLQSDSGYTGTITGPASVLKAVNSLHGTVTNGVFIIEADTHGGNKAWDGLAKLPDDDQIASVDETGDANTIAGWIKVKIGSSTRYIYTYDVAPSA